MGEEKILIVYMCMIEIWFIKFIMEIKCICYIIYVY